MPYLLAIPYRIGPDDRTRTCGILVPNQALYQTELHPDTLADGVLIRPFHLSSFDLSWKNPLKLRRKFSFMHGHRGGDISISDKHTVP